MVAPDLAPEVIAARIETAFLAKKIAVEAAGGTYGIRTAAKNIAERGADPKISASSWRVQLQRILRANSITPHASTRRLLAEEFGVEPAHFGVREVPVASGGEMFADLLDAIHEAQRLNNKLERQVVLLAETREGVAA